MAKDNAINDIKEKPVTPRRAYTAGIWAVISSVVSILLARSINSRRNVLLLIGLSVHSSKGEK